MEVRSRISIIIWGLFFFFIGMASALSREVRGVVRIAPPYPAPVKIPVKQKYQETCSREQVSQSLIISGEGYLKNVVVFLEGNVQNGREHNDAGIQAVMDQKNCNFTPHVLIVKQNRPFLIANSDPMAHDIRLFDSSRMLFRFEMDAFEKPVEKKLERPGIYVLRCGLHSWMHAFVVNVSHPYYAVTDEAGTFHFRDVPEGTYRMHIWHETLGETEVPLEVVESIHDFSYTFANPAQSA